MDEEQLKRAHQTVIDGLGSPRNLTMFGHVCLFAGKDAETARNTTATLMEGFIALEGLHLLVNRLGEGESAGIALTNPPDRTGYRVTERATQLLQLTVGAMHQVQSAFEFERPDEAL